MNEMENKKRNEIFKISSFSPSACTHTQQSVTSKIIHSEIVGEQETQYYDDNKKNLQYNE
jgi:hypothetical protein